MFHIVFNADENYIKFAAVLINSIIKNIKKEKKFKDLYQIHSELLSNFKKNENFNTDEGIVFHILSDFVSQSSRQKLENLSQNLSELYPCKIEIHLMKEEQFSHLPKFQGKFINYYRTKLDSLLPQDVECCLYLDVDMLVLFDIRELFTLDLEGKIAAVVNDIGSKRRKIKPKNTNLPSIFFDKTYFNSGFMLINLKFWRQNGLEKKLEYISVNYKLKPSDQDMLNAVIKPQDALQLPFAYNFFVKAFCFVRCKDECKNSLNYTRAEFNESLKSPKILHLCEKPWLFLKGYTMANGKDTSGLWWEVAEQTPFFDEELKELKPNANLYHFALALGFSLLKLSRNPFAFLQIPLFIKGAKSDEKELLKDFNEAQIPKELVNFALLLGIEALDIKSKGKFAFRAFTKTMILKRRFYKFRVKFDEI